MTIKRNDYWEHEEKERAALTHEEVVRLLDFELMRKGVLALDPLEPVPVPEVKLATTPFYRIRSARHHSVGLAFALEAQARTVLDAAPYLITSEYVGGGDSVEYVTGAAELSIECVELPTNATVEAAKLTLKEAAAAKTENERRTRAHAEQAKAVESATRGVWGDWHTCRAKAARMAKVEATFLKYCALVSRPDGTCDTITAQKFMRQVFTVAELVEAETWTGHDFGSQLDFGDVQPAGRVGHQDPRGEPAAAF